MILNVTNQVFISNIDSQYDYLSMENETNDETTELNYYDFDITKYIKIRNIFTWLSLVILLNGLIGNAYSFKILLRKSMRSTTNIYLANLCVSDLIALIFLLFNSILYEIFHYNNLNYGLGIIYYLYPYLYPLTNTFQMVSILLTVCVSMNQFFIFKYPTISETIKSKEIQFRRTYTIVTIVYIFSFLFCLPYWLKFKYSYEQGVFVTTEIGKSELYLKIVHFWLYFPFVYGLPFTILILTNAYIIKSLISYHRKRRYLLLQQIHLTEIAETITSSDNTADTSISRISLKLYNICKRRKRVNSSRSNVNVAYMLISVVLLFLLCELPALILHVFESIKCSPVITSNSYCTSNGLIYYGVFITKFLLICKLSLNVACFCFCSTQFRIEIIKLR